MKGGICFLHVPVVFGSYVSGRSRFGYFEVPSSCKVYLHKQDLKDGKETLAEGDSARPHA